MNLFFISISMALVLSGCGEKNLGRSYLEDDQSLERAKEYPIRIKLFPSSYPAYAVTSVNPFVSYKSIIDGETCSHLQLKVKIRSKIFNLKDGTVIKNSVNCESGDIKFVDLSDTFYLFAEFVDKNGIKKTTSNVKLSIFY